MTKSIFSVDIGEGAQSSLDAHVPLSLVSDDTCYHHANNLRMPLGIYNVSLSRICDKVIRLCERLESYFESGRAAPPQGDRADDLMSEVIDYIELALYAAAEHVDDIDSIATGFFKNKAALGSNEAYQIFSKAMKENKRFLSAATNAIKHQQSRIRIYTLEFSHNENRGNLHGFFIEGVEQGVVCPSSTFHRHQDVFSVTTLVWEIIVFLLKNSRDLALFLNSSSNQHQGPVSTVFAALSKATIAAARLPIYTFGEEHPFTRVTLRICASDGNVRSLTQGLYGSIANPWSKVNAPAFGAFIARFSGDGKSVSFKFPAPKTIVFHHWEG